ncbi:protein ENHANCED DISEASE RESISTANCE 2 isoform X2 [Benincasa hispida]|uniref:protein ENHANCED DISEASE RESISTANCE 2 isoform X2 n=1 Tax=Benincasa hispida TaxID=102211 RepID=UPI0019029830|nr:protein ENHANCED DISEASE RESISTANCE 2 isoform X2 [Benincasa hispida]
MEPSSLKKAGSESEGSGNSFSGGGREERGSFEYFGWVYHIGVNSIGHEYCHLRFLFIRRKYVELYKRDPHENPGIKPIRRGVVGPSLMVEELGRRKVNHGDVYVLRIYNRLDDSKKGEIACATAGEVRKWIEAFDHAKQQAEYELSRGASPRDKLNMEEEINLDGHRPRVRRYAHGLKKLIKIGQGPETLLRQSSNLNTRVGSDGFFEGDFGDAIERYRWKCVRTFNGVRIFEDVAESKSGKGVLVKSVGVVDAHADTVFDIILNFDSSQRYEWDTLMSDLELVESYDGHYDILYGTNNPTYLSQSQCKRDFVFSRQWFRGQDGTYTILQVPCIHKKKPPKSGLRRTRINPSTWEIRCLNTAMGSNMPKCLVTQILEIQPAGWFKWQRNHPSKFEKSVPYALLCQVAGLKEYVLANPALNFETLPTVVRSKISDVSTTNSDYDDEVHDEFYDAIAADSSSSEEDSDNDKELGNKELKVKLKNVSWAIAGFSLKRSSAVDANKELDPSVAPIILETSEFHGSLQKGRDDKDTNCWTSPSGAGFMIRGKNYLKDNSKVMGGDPLLKLIAVDWFKVDKSFDGIALHPRNLVQSQAGKKVPFMLVINLQGYWMVKRAVGTKACLLGKAVTCKYLRRDNFLEIDVDIGSSTVARSVIGLVLGYVTSLVVDLAILIEAKEEEELPEYILGTVRLNRVKLDSAIHLED